MPSCAVASTASQHQYLVLRVRKIPDEQTAQYFVEAHVVSTAQAPEAFTRRFDSAHRAAANTDVSPTPEQMRAVGTPIVLPAQRGIGAVRSAPQ